MRKAAANSGGDPMAARDQNVVSDFRGARSLLAAVPSDIGIRSGSRVEKKQHVAVFGCFSVFLAQ
jgi:hypothetical protein